MKSVVVTGTSTGIGRACALRLDKMGYRVFGSVRKQADAESLQAAASERFTPIMMDTTDMETVAAVAKEIAEMTGAGLDGLVNNAGIAVAGPLEFLPTAALRRSLEINVIAQVGVTQALMPLLRQARGRIVNISSVSGRIAAPFMGPYAASKFGLEAISDALRVELSEWGMFVSVIQPGATRSAIWHKSIDQTKKMLEELPPQADEFYGEAIRATFDFVQNKSAKSRVSPELVVDAVIHALTAKKPKTRYRIGTQSKVADLIARFLPDRLRDRLILRQRSTSNSRQFSP